MNQVIRIIFDDNISKEFVDRWVESIELELGNLSSIEVYEEEFEEDENGQEQRQGSE